MNNLNSDLSIAPVEQLTLTQEWDKVFPKSDKVNHRKVTFVNRYGITLAADMYTPTDAEGKLAAIAVSGPFGAVKEQSSGLYAQQLAERGYLTIAFDPSFTGESGGHPRRVASPDINTEEFSAAVDFLSVQPDVDAARIGILGVCGWGGKSKINSLAVARLTIIVRRLLYFYACCSSAKASVAIFDTLILFCLAHSFKSAGKVIFLLTVLTFLFNHLVIFTDTHEVC